MRAAGHAPTIKHSDQSPESIRILGRLRLHSMHGAEAGKS